MKNQIGLEAEFFLRDENDELLLPSTKGFSTDEYILLGEFRGTPGDTRAECIGNFLKAYYKILFRAKNLGLKLDIDTGHTTISPQFYAEVLRQMDRKFVSQCKNIYPKIDLLELSDQVIKAGKITEVKASIGLHVHFSSYNVVEKSTKEYDYEPFDIPLSIKGLPITINTFKRNRIKEEVIEAKASRITTPVIKHIIGEFDEAILPAFVGDLPELKYRNPGFYELKPWGFEYRSLPFNKNVLEHIDDIVDFAFKKLEEL